MHGVAQIGWKAVTDHIRAESKLKIAMLQHDLTVVSELIAIAEKLPSIRQQPCCPASFA